MLKKVKDLKLLAAEVEKRIPLLAFSEVSDEMTQVKFFIYTYYRPILKDFEIPSLLSGAEIND